MNTKDRAGANPRARICTACGKPFGVTYFLGEPFHPRCYRNRLKGRTAMPRTPITEEIRRQVDFACGTNPAITSHALDSDRVYTDPSGQMYVWVLGTVNGRPSVRFRVNVEVA